MSVPRVLAVAGTDPTGGAGIQADLKSISALGGYAMAVVTALVAQNTRGVRSVHVPPVDFLTEQLDAVSDDVVIDAVKLGMLHSSPVIEAVERWLERTSPPIVVLDPVMVATSGDRLLDAAAEDAIRALCARVDLVTPNVPELAVLTGRPTAATWDDAVHQATTLARESGAAVLLKGGHLPGATCSDAVVTTDSVAPIHGRRVDSANTHGTGCSLSSAMATLAAQGLTWSQALTRAKSWLSGAIEHGADLEVGEGNGPVDHFHELRPNLVEPDWCAGVWDATASLRSRVDSCDFVRGLRDGDLARERFHWYLEQDAVYLGEYSRALSRASALAPSTGEQVFWATSAANALAEEARLHRARIGDRSSAAAPTTLAYVNHLHATAAHGDYAELVAALVPCFWLYADLGTRLAAGRRPTHPYADWLDTYADPAFAAATETARETLERTAAGVPAAVRHRMRRAFIESMRHELAFFEAPQAAYLKAASETDTTCPAAGIPKNAAIDHADA